jgi:ABC-2 type transport system permease protein
MRYYFRIWRSFFNNCLAREMEYRGHLVMQFMIDMVWYGVQIGLFEVIYLNTPTVAGMNHASMLVFLGTLFVADAVNMMIFSHNFWHFPEYIRTGELDFFLVKPASTFFLVFFRYVNVAALLNLLFGVGFLIVAVHRAELVLTAWNLVLFAVMFCAGLCVNIAIQTTIAALSVWIVAGEGVQYLYHSLFSFATRPDAIYKGQMRRILLTALPFALIASVPARALAGTLSPTLAVWSVCASVVMLVASVRLFTYSLSKYSGASA